MTPRKLNVYVAFFNYAGNGGIACEAPAIRKWWGQTVLKIKDEERIGFLKFKDYTDTPIPMTRNRAARDATEIGADLIMMVDSDQKPDMYMPFMAAGENEADPTAKEFFPTAFEFLYEHYDKGPAFVAAPYVGPPPQELVYMFEVGSPAPSNPGRPWEMKMISREDAEKRLGIQPVMAAATGLILFDTRCFKYLPPPYFDYEYTDQWRTAKASTEDVFATRNIILHLYNKFRYHAGYCNWDAWAGHYKPLCAGKPRSVKLEQIHESLADCIRRENSGDERLVHWHSEANGERRFEIPAGGEV